MKREQVGKTGRFGVGFNSVYHLTDMPSFVSGRHIVFFDPHCKFLPNISAANPGKRIDFVTNDVLGQHGDQFSPFAAFGCDMRSHFDGTMFRFPLRTAEQAAVSRLSKASYTSESVRGLLRAFAEEKVLDLLYLKNVERIEVLEWGVNDGERRESSRCRRRARRRRSFVPRAAFSRARRRSRRGSIEPRARSRLSFILGCGGRGRRGGDAS